MILHTDEATHAVYHYSCVLYLSTQGHDFTGGAGPADEERLLETARKLWFGNPVTDLRIAKEEEVQTSDAPTVAEAEPIDAHSAIGILVG